MSDRTTLAPSSGPLPRSGSGPAMGRLRRRREARAGWLFLLPDGVGLLLFVGLPMVLALLVSFFNVDGFGNYTFVGLRNFAQMGSDPLLWRSVRVTLTIMLTFVPITFVLSLAVAVLVKDKFPGVGAVRSMFFVPNVLSLVVIGVLWQFMLVEKRGVLTQFLGAFGLGNISWLGTPSLALGTVIAASVWYTLGYQMFLFLGGLADIPQEFLEAAKVDGANAWGRFRNVIWPLLAPTSFFVLITSIVASVTGVQAFDLIYVLTKGGPANSTSTVVFYIYQQAFQFGNYGYAAAITSFTVLFLVAISVVLLLVTRGGRFNADAR